MWFYLLIKRVETTKVVLSLYRNEHIVSDMLFIIIYMHSLRRYVSICSLYIDRVGVQNGMAPIEDTPPPQGIQVDDGHPVRIQYAQCVHVCMVTSWGYRKCTVHIRFNPFSTGTDFRNQMYMVHPFNIIYRNELFIYQKNKYNVDNFQIFLAW